MPPFSYQYNPTQLTNAIGAMMTGGGQQSALALMQAGQLQAQGIQSAGQTLGQGFSSAGQSLASAGSMISKSQQQQQLQNQLFQQMLAQSNLPTMPASSLGSVGNTVNTMPDFSSLGLQQGGVGGANPIGSIGNVIMPQQNQAASLGNIGNVVNTMPDLSTILGGGGGY